MKKMTRFLFTFGVFILNVVQADSIPLADLPQLVVKGEASVFKPSNQMEASIGVVTSAENSSSALNENNQRIRQIQANFKSLGLSEEDYQTGSFRIRPLYQKSSKETDEKDPGKIVGYEAINSIKIKTEKIILADKIFRTAVDAGANKIDSVHFSLTNPQSYREEAIKLATQYALADASALSNAANVRLKRILHLSLDYWQQLSNERIFSKNLDLSAGNPFDLTSEDIIDPGMTEIRANVHATFEISP